VSAAPDVALTLEAPAAREDELAGRLWQLGCLGNWNETEEGGRLRLRAVFPAAADGPELRAALTAVDGVRVVGVEPLPDADWNAAWRAAAQPVTIGERFLVDPREPGPDAAPLDAGGRWLLRLPVRTAFGVGSHESTRLALELLELSEPAGRRALDVGTGTGILAFAALLLGARDVVAFDLDPAAALLLPEYMRLNRLRPRAFAGTLAALGPRAGRFDLALVNVLPHEIADELPRLRALLAPGARVVLSGLLADEAAASLARLAPLGLREAGRRVAGEWSGLLLEVAP
jgi:ribosomal protein L11 methyltransferase